MVPCEESVILSFTVAASEARIPLMNVRNLCWDACTLFAIKYESRSTNHSLESPEYTEIEVLFITVIRWS